MSGIDQTITLAGRAYRLREIAAEDAPAVLALFKEVFGERPPEGWYAWKYGAAGLDGRALGLWDEDGRLVAHYAGFPRRLLWHGRPVAGIQIGDVMVAPHERGRLMRQGPFFCVCQTFYQHWIGADKAFTVSYGFPNARHMRLGVHLGFYQDRGSVHSWVWPAQAQRLSWFWRVREVQPSDPGFDAWIDAAWLALQRAMPDRVLGVRDAAHLRARFVARPGVAYRFFQVSRRGFGPGAVAVLRADGETLRWLDFIGPLNAFAVTAQAIQGVAADWGLLRVETWAAGAASDALRTAGGRLSGEAARFALARPSHCPDETLATAGWWLAGDTDFL